MSAVGERETDAIEREARVLILRARLAIVSAEWERRQRQRKWTSPYAQGERI